MKLVIPAGMSGEQLKRMQANLGGTVRECIVLGCPKPRLETGPYCKGHDGGNYKLHELKRCQSCGAFGHTSLRCDRRGNR
jgi:hypothetical protein